MPLGKSPVGRRCHLAVSERAVAQGRQQRTLDHRGHLGSVGPHASAPGHACVRVRAQCGHGDVRVQHGALDEAIRLPFPAEACTLYDHPNLWSWRSLVDSADKGASFVAVVVSDASEMPVDRCDEPFLSRSACSTTGPAGRTLPGGTTTSPGRERAARDRGRLPPRSHTGTGRYGRAGPRMWPGPRGAGAGRRGRGAGGRRRRIHRDARPGPAARHGGHHGHRGRVLRPRRCRAPRPVRRRDLRRRHLPTRAHGHPDLDATLRAAHRVTRPGGWFVFVIGHPCFLAPDAVRVTTALGRPAVQVTGYFAERFWRSTNPQGVRRAGNHHRTLATYLNALSGAGLVLEPTQGARAGRTTVTSPAAGVPAPTPSTPGSTWRH